MSVCALCAVCFVSMWECIPHGMLTITIAQSHTALPSAGHFRFQEQVGAMKKLIKSMNFTAFSSEKFENPSLQKHFAVLEALALDRDMPAM